MTGESGYSIEIGPGLLADGARLSKPLRGRHALIVSDGNVAPLYLDGVAAALAEARPGDVIVVANDGYLGTAVVGDLVIGMMRNKGVAAFVTEGLARDKAGILATGLPVFCAGIVPTSPATNGPGTVGAPVTCGGIHIRPGDIVVGDIDGVVVVPAHDAERVVRVGEVLRGTALDAVDLLHVVRLRADHAGLQRVAVVVRDLLPQHVDVGDGVGALRGRRADRGLGDLGDGDPADADDGGRGEDHQSQKLAEEGHCDFISLE